MTRAALPILLAVFLQAPSPPAGAIRGRVVDKETGRPLARATVRLSPLVDPGETLKTKTDERGVFMFERLPPGRYGGLVSAPKHVMEPLTSGAIVVTRDQVSEITVALNRTYAIDVRVLDSFGDPLSGVTVTTRSVDTGRGGMNGQQHPTDDLGRLRLFGLEPGRYAVCADTGDMGTSFDARATRSEKLLKTCYPSADEDGAAVVTIDRADVDGIEIRMRRGRTFTVAGLVVDASGTAAPSARAGLAQYEGNGSSSTSIEVGADGRFRIANLAPGEYVIEATLGGVELPDRMRPDEAGSVPFRIADTDLDDLVVTLRKTVDVQGRVTLEDPTAPIPAPGGSGLMIQSRLAEGVRAAGDSSNTLVRNDRTFTILGTYGLRGLDFLNVPRGWYVKTARYGDRDVIDEPVEFKGGANAPSLDIVLSNRGAVVTGTVAGDDGRPAARAMIVAFRTIGLPVPRMSAYARSTATGTFTLCPMRGGDYALVALPATSPLAQWGVWDRIARLIPKGEQVSLTEVDERSVALRFAADK
jgi:hypothetical protein